MFLPCVANSALLVSLALSIWEGTRVSQQQTEVPGSALSRGTQLVYASQGAESAPWTVDSIDLRAQFGAATRCSYIRFGARDIRKTCASGDTLFAFRDSTQKLVASRPLRSGATLTVATAGGGSAVYETTDSEIIVVSGMNIRVVKTTVTTKDASGKAVRRLRERFALSLGTATDGVFEALQPDGSWKITQEFALARIVKP